MCTRKRVCRFYPLVQGDRELVAYTRAFPENKGLLDLTLSTASMADVNWGAIALLSSHARHSFHAVQRDESTHAEDGGGEEIVS